MDAVVLYTEEKNRNLVKSLNRIYHLDDRATNYRAKNAPRTDGMRNCVNPEVLRENIQLRDCSDSRNENDANNTAEPTNVPVLLQLQTTRSNRTVRSPANSVTILNDLLC